jgi:adenylate cyclase
MNFDIMGDGQMIVFGADEFSRKNHAYMAVKSSIEMLAELEKLNQSWSKENRKKVTIGIGINTGDVSLGFLGSNQAGQRKQFAAIGDTTNVAARIEGLTKTLGTQIIISETTYDVTKDKIITEELPPTQVKGKDLPLKIYKLIGLKDRVRTANVE